jgi:XRE family aerobic/anaerobic benzoate catabolism transcriptional regulator
MRNQNEKDDKNLLLASLGAQARVRRLEAGLTVKEFAARAALSPRFVIQLEAGQANISIAGLARAAAALGCSLQELIPPLNSDLSLRAQIWHQFSRCGDEELRELQRWFAERSKQPAPRFLALIGLRGAGKSTVGPMIAKRLQAEFVEVDALIEKAAGMSLGEIFTLHDGEYYRRLERAALIKLFTESSGGVLAVGGSLVTDAESWEMVKRHCFTVWLHATPSEFMRRLRRQGDTRPMQNSPSAMTELKSLLARREPLYAQAELTIKTTGKAPAAVAAQILKALAAINPIKSQSGR